MKKTIFKIMVDGVNDFSIMIDKRIAQDSELRPIFSQFLRDTMGCDFELAEKMIDEGSSK